VIRVLIDVRDPQLRLPQEGVVGAPEDLALLGDRCDDRLEGGAAVSDAEAARRDLLVAQLERVLGLAQLA